MMWGEVSYPFGVFDALMPVAKKKLFSYRVEMELGDGRVFVLNIKDWERELSVEEQERMTVEAYHREMYGGGG